MSVLHLLIPWEPSAPLVAIFIAVSLAYWLGARHRRISLARRTAFWSGLWLFYLSLHTGVDYYAEHEFFAHRLQHLVLHHLAPLLIMASYPGSVLRAGLPLSWRGQLRKWQRTTLVRALSRIFL